QELEYDGAMDWGWAFPVTREYDEVLGDFKDFGKDRNDLKTKSVDKETSMAEKILLPALVSKRGDLIAHGFETGAQHNLVLIFRLGYDITLNSREYGPEMERFKAYARDFMAYAYEQSYARRIDVLEKEVKATEKDLKQNENKIDGLEKKVANLNKKISQESDQIKIDEFKSEIVTNLADRDALQETLPGLKAQIDNLTSNADKLRTESHQYQVAIADL
ncbi:MAG: hypothetical protein R2751_20150, partial [Bacteroidales bacterium]